MNFLQRNSISYVTRSLTPWCCLRLSSTRKSAVLRLYYGMGLRMANIGVTSPASRLFSHWPIKTSLLYNKKIKPSGTISTTARSLAVALISLFVMRLMKRHSPTRILVGVTWIPITSRGTGGHGRGSVGMSITRGILRWKSGKCGGLSLRRERKRLGKWLRDASVIVLFLCDGWFETFHKLSI